MSAGVGFDVDVDSLTGLDFSFEQPCEHSQHKARHVVEESASWLVKTLCPMCRERLDIFLCDSGLNILYSPGTITLCICGYATHYTNYVLALVPVKGGSFDVS